MLIKSLCNRIYNRSQQANLSQQTNQTQQSNLSHQSNPSCKRTWGKYVRNLLMLCLAMALVMSSLMPAYARSLKQIEQDQENTKKEISNIKHDIAETSKEIIELVQTVEKLEYQKEANEDQLNLLAVEIKNTEKAIVQAEVDLAKRRDYLGDRLRYIYEDGAIGYFEVLLGSKNFSDFVNRFEFLKEIVNSDNVLIDSIQEKKDFIQAQKNKLTKKQQEVTSTKRKLENSIVQLEGKQNQLEKQIDDNNKAARKAAEELDKLEAEEDAEIERIAREARNKGNGNDVFQGEGEFLWPMPVSYSRISSDFGPRNSPVPGASSYHKGIDIPAPIGTSVAATQGGTVLYSTTMRGYGNVVWINHGDGIVSVYGHLNSISVSEGQKVQKGQIIAHSGNTGVSSGPHLHFEIRQDGSARNPLNYVRQP